MKKENIPGKLKQSFTVTVILMLLCGLVFPLVLAGISSVLFPTQAKGNLVEAGGRKVGSEYVGQQFTEAYFMKGRPSAVGYNTYETKEEALIPSSGSDNFAPSNPELVKRVETDMEAFLKANPDINKEDIPTDLLTASGSGLDPHISPASAEIQIPAIAEASGISEKQLAEIVKNNTNGKLFGLIGEETVNVLGVNIEIAEEMGLLEK